MITRSPLSPHFNPYNKDTLEVFPNKHKSLLYAVATYFSTNVSQQITHVMCVHNPRNDKRSRYICHYISSLNLKLYTCPILGVPSIAYKVSFCTINGFLAPSSSGMFDQHSAPHTYNSTIFTIICQKLGVKYIENFS